MTDTPDPTLDWLEANNHCDKEGFTPEHKDCRCRKVAAVIREVETLRATNVMWRAAVVAAINIEDNLSGQRKSDALEAWMSIAKQAVKGETKETGRTLWPT